MFADEDKIVVEVFQGLTVDFCKKVNAEYIIRGLRTSSDFEYERAIAQNNNTLYPGIETLFLLTKPDHTHINSTIVREIIVNKGDYSKFVPSIIAENIKALE